MLKLFCEKAVFQLITEQNTYSKREWEEREREWEESGKRVGRVGYSKGERVYGLHNSVCTGTQHTQVIMIRTVASN